MKKLISQTVLNEIYATANNWPLEIRKTGTSITGPLILNHSAVKRLTLVRFSCKKGVKLGQERKCLTPYKGIYNTDVTLTGTNGLKTDTFSHNRKLVRYILRVTEFIFFKEY